VFGPSGGILSAGLLITFQARHRFKQFKSHGESGSADFTVIELAMSELKNVITQYDPSDVFNMDQSGWYYRMDPDETIARNRISWVKKDQTGISMAFATNATNTTGTSKLF
jgi:hypothetical protein